MNILLRQKNLLILTLAPAPLGTVNAHPGHADPITISRDTHVYMQKLVPPYLKIQSALAEGELNETVKEAADAIKQLVDNAWEKERDPSGKRMYKGVAKAAGFVAAANNIDVAREAFAEFNDTLLPFFDSWPNHILEHNLVLYICKETKQWWLQTKGDKAADPYRGASVPCVDLVEKEE